MMHTGRNTKSTIISKGIAAGKSQNSYRGLVKVLPKAHNARNFSKCDSLLLGSDCGAHTFSYIETQNSLAKVEHEASTREHGLLSAMVLLTSIVFVNYLAQMIR